MSRASKSVNAAYIRSALEVKAQRDEALEALQTMVDSFPMATMSEQVEAKKVARAIIKKAKKWK